MYELRGYQKKAIKKVFEELKTYDEALLSLGCGSGKTVILSALIEHVLKMKPDFKAVVLVNKNILIPQTVSKFNIDVGIYSAGCKLKQLEYPITVASVQSLANCKSFPNVDLCIADECHSLRLCAGQGKAAHEILGKPKVLGLTATPFYPDGRALWGAKEFFKRPPCFTMSMKQLTLNGYLSPLVFAGEGASTKIDTSKVRKTKDDYVVFDLEQTILKSSDKVRLQVKDIIKRTQDRKKVAILCVSIKHAKLVLQILEEHAQDAVILHSKMHHTQQKISKDNFMGGGYKFLVSVMMVTVGFDFPELDALAICRPTRSKVLFVQAVGRVTRLAKDKKNGLVLDYGGIVPHLGHPYGISPLLNNNKISMKICIKCLGYFPTSSSKCPECGTTSKVMCAFCFEMKDYGAKCACGHKRHIDQYKNLTPTVSRRLNRYEVKKVSIYDHKAKSGRTMPRIDYIINHLGFSRVIASEFIFNQSLDEIKSRYKQPKFILVGKNQKGYNAIMGKEY
jgi:DNA repair protein RadD